MSESTTKKRLLHSTISDQDTKKRKTENTDQRSDTVVKFLSPVYVYILQAGIEKLRMQIFKTQLAKFGGILKDQLSSEVTHIIVDDKMEADRMCRLLKIDKPPDYATVVKSSWLSTCFKEKKLVDTQPFMLDLSVLEKKPLEKKPVDNTSGDIVQDKISKPELPKVGFMFGQKAKQPQPQDDEADSDYVNSDAGSDGNDSGPEFPSEQNVPSSSGKSLPKGNWVCAQSSKNPRPNVNQHITDKLEEMVRTYESTNDKWRAFGYQKAIQVLRRQTKPITTFEEAKALPSVGKKLAEKIWEIAESGELRKLNEFKSNEEIRVIEMFKDVWGAGATTARTWYQQGLRTLDDLKTKGNPTSQQKIGLKHYHDFLDRMPREEAGEIERVVKEAAESLVDGVIAQACGSYRRGKKTCGDVDVLVTHPDGKSHRGLFAKLLAKLKAQGFLTDDLVTAEENGNQKKYLGVCKLPGENQKYRRIDIIVVPYDEYACAIVYFTGSAHFNRSLRHLAKKSGMSLSEHSLNKGVVRHGAEKVYEGTPVPTPTEESVFIQMGIPYRPPEERDH